MEEPKRLYRSRYDKVIAGVASGIGKYFNIDPIIIRILFVAVALMGGGGVLIYIILWIAIPENPDFAYFTHENKTAEETVKNENPESEPVKETYNPYPDYEKRKNNGNLIAGIILISVGGLFLIDRFVPRIHFHDLWPVLLIVIGLLIIKNSFSKSKSKIQ